MLAMSGDSSQKLLLGYSCMTSELSVDDSGTQSIQPELSELSACVADHRGSCSRLMVRL